MKRYKTIGLVLGGVALFFVALDGLLRLLGTGVPPGTLCPDGSPNGAFRYEPRNQYLETSPDDESDYVVCFGDGWTFGLGVERREAWPAVLEQLLQRHDPNLRVVNSAAVGETSTDVAKIFKRQLVRYRSRQAVVMIGAADATPADLLEKYPPGDPFKAGFCRPPRWRLGHVLARRLEGYKLRLYPLDPPDDQSSRDRRIGITQAQLNFMKIAGAAQELGARVIFVTYPKLSPVQPGDPHLPLESRYNFLVAGAVTVCDGAICDLEKRWGDKTGDYLLSWMLWPHPNAKGHADIAKAVAGLL